MYPSEKISTGKKKKKILGLAYIWNNSNKIWLIAGYGVPLKEDTLLNGGHGFLLSFYMEQLQRWV